MRGISIALAVAVGMVTTGTQVQAGPGYRLIKLERHQLKWGAPVFRTGAVVTYGFVTRRMQFAQARNCKGMAPVTRLLSRLEIPQETFRAEAEAAFALWAQVANISFRPAAPGAPADILIGVQTRPRGRAFTNVDYATDTGGTGPHRLKQALICLNPRQDWKVGFDGDLEVYDLRFTLAHEIGHAIGLDHPAAENELMGFRYHERFRAPQAGDIAGAAALYGPRLLADRRGREPPRPPVLEQADASGDTGDETPQLSLGEQEPRARTDASASRAHH